jgi:hypothetical protein
MAAHASLFSQLPQHPTQHQNSTPNSTLATICPDIAATMETAPNTSSPPNMTTNATGSTSTASSSITTDDEIVVEVFSPPVKSKQVHEVELATLADVDFIEEDVDDPVPVSKTASTVRRSRQ